MDSHKIVDAIENGKLADASEMINDVLLSRIGSALEERKTDIGETLVQGVDVQEEEDSEYDRFFRAALKKFGVSSPADFESDEEKKKFFNYVDKNFKAKHESVELDEASVKITPKEEKELKDAIQMYNKMAKKDRKFGNVADDVADLLHDLKIGDMESAKVSFGVLDKNAQEMVPDSVYEKLFM